MKRVLHRLGIYLAGVGAVWGLCWFLPVPVEWRVATAVCLSLFWLVLFGELVLRSRL